MKKNLLSVMMIALAAFVLLPTVKSVSADEATYAKVNTDPITNLGDVKNETITVKGDNEVANINVDISGIELDWSNNEEPGRTNGWWVGVKIEAPESIDEANSKIIKEDGTEYIFEEVKDSEVGDPTQYVYIWLYVDHTMKDAVKTYTYNFEWVKGEDVTKQTIAFNIDLEGATLNAPSEETCVSVVVNGNGSREFFLEKGQSLKDLTKEDKALLEKIKTPTNGYEYVGIFDEKGVEYKDDTTIENNVTLNVKFNKVVTATGSNELDKTPKTGNNNLIGFISIITLISLASVVTLKKRMQ